MTTSTSQRPLVGPRTEPVPFYFDPNITSHGDPGDYVLTNGQVLPATPDAPAAVYGPTIYSGGNSAVPSVVLQLDAAVARSHYNESAAFFGAPAVWERVPRCSFRRLPQWPQTC